MVNYVYQLFDKKILLKKIKCKKNCKNKRYYQIKRLNLK